MTVEMCKVLGCYAISRTSLKAMVDMQVENTNPFGTLSHERLEAFEQEIGCTLPLNYRTFLLTHNGGMPVPSAFSISDEEGETCINEIYGLHDGPSYARLDEMRQVYRGRISEALLPIGDDSFGNVICLGIAGQHQDKVYFWDHELEFDRESMFDNTTRIADSFADFLALLREPSDE